jgi:hypothetical protein
MVEVNHDEIAALVNTGYLAGEMLGNGAMIKKAIEGRNLRYGVRLSVRNC